MPVVGLINYAPRHQAFVVRRKLRKPAEMLEKSFLLTVGQGATYHYSGPRHDRA
jgi:hypothetical protein